MQLYKLASAFDPEMWGVEFLDVNSAHQNSKTNSALVREREVLPTSDNFFRRWEITIFPNLVGTSRPILRYGSKLSTLTSFSDVALKLEPTTTPVLSKEYSQRS